MANAIVKLLIKICVKIDWRTPKKTENMLELVFQSYIKDI